MPGTASGGDGPPASKMIPVMPGQPSAELTKISS